MIFKQTFFDFKLYSHFGNIEKEIREDYILLFDVLNLNIINK